MNYNAIDAFLDRVGFRLSVVAQKTTLAIDEGKRSFTAQMPVFNKGLDALMKEVAESFPFQEVLDVQGVIIPKTNLFGLAGLWVLSAVPWRFVAGAGSVTFSGCGALFYAAKGYLGIQNQRNNTLARKSNNPRETVGNTS